MGFGQRSLAELDSSLHSNVITLQIKRSFTYLYGRASRGHVSDAHVRPPANRRLGRGARRVRR